MTRGANVKVVHEPPYCPSCRVELEPCGDELDRVVRDLRGGDLGWGDDGENRTAQCETFNCFHAGRNADGLTTIFLVTTRLVDWSCEEHASDVMVAEPESIGWANEDGIVGLSVELDSRSAV